VVNVFPSDLITKRSAFNNLIGRRVPCESIIAGDRSDLRDKPIPDQASRFFNFGQEAWVDMLKLGSRIEQKTYGSDQAIDS
jgi:hypothetical protein